MYRTECAAPKPAAQNAFSPWAERVLLFAFPLRLPLCAALQPFLPPFAEADHVHDGAALGVHDVVGLFAGNVGGVPREAVGVEPWDAFALCFI